MIRTLDTSLQIIVTYDDEKVTQDEALNAVLVTVQAETEAKGVSASAEEFHFVHETTEGVEDGED